MTNTLKMKSPQRGEDEVVEIIPMRNTYVSGICPTCEMEFVDLEGHFKKIPYHKKEEPKVEKKRRK